MEDMLLVVRTKSRVGVLNLAYPLELLGDKKQKQNETKLYLGLSQNKLNQNLLGVAWTLVCFYLFLC